MNQRPTSFHVIFAILAIILVGLFKYYEFWKSKVVIDWDVSQYYSYLPATFIYQDYAFDDPDSLWMKAHLRLLPMQDGQHTHPVKMSYGVAAMYMPFFLGAHFYTQHFSEFPQDGFSPPYKFSLLLSSLSFALLGLWFLGNWLQNYVSPLVSGIVVLSIFLGTNLPYYTFVEPMSHVFGFALFSFILYATNKYLNTQSLKLAILIGFSSAFLILIRPTNLILLIFPALTLLPRYRYLNLQMLIRHIILLLVIVVIVWIPQFLYWKYMTGQYVYYSYHDEGFFFTDPEIWKGLFSYRKGWFVYSPLLFLTIPGFILMIMHNRSLALSAVITLFVGLWITFSWWCWWYGGSFGARSMIEYLPLMGLALAILIQQSKKAPKLFQLSLYLSIAAFCFLSLIFNNFYSRGIIHPDSMSRELFWDQMTSDDFVKNHQQLMDPPDYDKAKRNED